MKTIISIIIIGIGLFILIQSCKPKVGCAGMPQIFVHYVDKNGNDLFTNGQNGYYMDSAYFKNTSGNIISGANYFVNYPTTSTILLASYENVSDKYSAVIIHLKNGVEDTLKRHLTSSGCPQLDSIWYNGQLKKAGTQTINGVTNPDLVTTMFTIVH